MMIKFILMLLCMMIFSARCFSPPSPRIAQSISQKFYPSTLSTTQRGSRRDHCVVLSREPRRGGDNPIEEILDELPIGTILSISLLFAFPGFFLGLFNTFFVAIFVLPPLIGFGFQLWARSALLTSECPNCGAPVQGLKSSAETICFNCGTPLVQTSKRDGWRIRSKFDDDDPSSPGGGGNRKPPGSGVIDVEAIDV
uniref:Uncharacterized protein n=1 Tax=Aureoumbra lagunensis TaxID=44058 RepID=A0A7S3NN95_9STRA|mmetsp:Transcript_13753/g.18344  ORF Transcript_13753/g.18344 Transcript_13753/m.18344 type:complete len:197 (+) Transcript_13753:73-663(+)